jgi:hypothetical protein
MKYRRHSMQYELLKNEFVSCENGKQQFAGGRFQFERHGTYRCFEPGDTWDLLCIMYYVLCIMYYVLCIMYYILYHRSMFYTAIMRVLLCGNWEIGSWEHSSLWIEKSKYSRLRGLGQTKSDICLLTVGRSDMLYWTGQRCAVLASVRHTADNKQHALGGKQ